MIEERFKNVFFELQKLGRVKNKSCLANELQLYPQAVENMLQGKRKIDADILQTLAISYKVNPNYIIGVSNIMFL
jgi:hypothetical protein